MHLLVDSTGLKLFGSGEWLIETHGTKTRRSWRKLHIGVHAETGQILAAELTGPEVDDGSRVNPLLDQVAGPIASFTGDGAYDRDDVTALWPDAIRMRQSLCRRVPAPAVPGKTAETAPTQRDGHFEVTAERCARAQTGVRRARWRLLQVR